MRDLGLDFRNTRLDSLIFTCGLSNLILHNYIIECKSNTTPDILMLSHVSTVNFTGCNLVFDIKGLIKLMAYPIHLNGTKLQYLSLPLLKLQ